MSGTGKLIYQLTSAAALKDTDLFVISSADNLTRSVTLSQLKKAIIGEFSDDTDLLDGLRSDIKNLNDTVSEYGNNLSEFRNEFNAQLQVLGNRFATDLNNVRSEFNTSITNLDTSLQEKITNLDLKLSKKIDEMITYGTAVPTTLATGKVYLQYF